MATKSSSKATKTAPKTLAKKTEAKSKGTKKVKEEKPLWSLEPGRYIIGDYTNLYEEKDAKKVEKFLKKVNKNTYFGKEETLKFYYFRMITATPAVTDYVDNITPKYIKIPSKFLIFAKEEDVKEGKIFGCRRIQMKEKFFLEFKYDNVDSELDLFRTGEPRVDFMFVEEDLS